MLAVLIVSGCSSTPDGDTPYIAEANAKEACENSIKNQLSDPGSAQFSQEQVTKRPDHQYTPPATLETSAAATDHFYIIVGMVNAKNKFGGYVGDEAFSCEAVVHQNGDATGIANIADNNSTPTDTPDDDTDTPTPTE
ncbi:hypothetical protein [Gordonia oryzae]